MKPKALTVDLDEQDLTAVSDVCARYLPKWTPAQFIACAIANQIEVLRHCGYNATHIDANLRPLIPVPFTQPHTRTWPPTGKKPLAPVLRLVPPTSGQDVPAGRRDEVQRDSHSVGSTV